MTVNELVDLLAGHIAAGNGNAEVLVSMAAPGAASDTAYEALTAHDWTVGGATDEARNGFVSLDLRASR